MRSRVAVVGGGQFADLYVADGVIFVGFTDAPERRLRELQRGLGPGIHLLAFEARHSLAELERTRDKFSGDRAALAAKGITIVTLTIDVKRNVVAVGVTDPNPEVEAVLRRRYGHSVMLRPHRTVARPTQATPMAGAKRSAPRRAHRP